MAFFNRLIMKLIIKKYWDYASFVLAFVIPIILIVLPTNYFDSGKSLCLSQVLFQQECYGCGITRACMHLIHFDIGGAYYYNALSFIVFPMLCLMWLVGTLKKWKFVSGYLKQAKSSK